MSGLTKASTLREQYAIIISKVRPAGREHNRPFICLLRLFPFAELMQRAGE